MDIQADRREQYRYTRNDKLFVQLLAHNEKADVSSVTTLCSSRDASIHGLKVEIETELSVDSQVDLWLAFEGLDEKFYLRGHVCWCYGMENNANLYQTGIELEDCYATDYDAWIKLLDSFSG